MKRNILSILIIYSILIGCINLAIINTHPVRGASVEYTQNFDAYANKTEDLTLYQGGSLWLSVETNTNDDAVGTRNGIGWGTYVNLSQTVKNKVYDFHSNTGEKTFFNLSVTPTKIIYYINTNFSGASTDSYFYTSTGEQLCRLWFGDLCRVFDEGNNIADTGTAWTGPGNGKIEVEFFHANETIHISADVYEYAAAYDVDTWLSPSNYDFCTNFVVDTGGVYPYMDNLTVYAADTTYLWELDELSYGNVVTSLDHSTTLSSNNLEYTVEVENDEAPTPITINQVALAVGVNTDLGGTREVRLKLNDVEVGDFSSYYTHGSDRLILVWKDLNQSVTGDVLCEFKYIQQNPLDNFVALYDLDDIDNDGDVLSYWSYDGNNYNGIYGYGTQNNRDLIYEVWYELSETAVQYGNTVGNDTIGGIDLTGVGCAGLSYKYLEWDYDIPLNCQINIFDIVVCDDLYTYDSNLGNYVLKINNQNSETPDYWIPLSDDFYMLRWVLNTPVTISNLKPFFELYHPVKDPDANVYWYMGLEDTDTDNDGDIQLFQHDNAWMFGDGSYGGTTSLAYEPIYRFWYTGGTTVPPQYTDSIITDKDTYDVYENIHIGATVSDITYVNSVNITYWNGASWVDFTSQDYPRQFSTYDFYGIFQAETASDNSGNPNYNISLLRNGVVQDNKLITVNQVTGDQAKYAIITTPNPSDTNENVKIRYLFNRSDITYARIYKTNSENFYKESGHLDYWAINTTTSLTYLGTTTFTDTGKYYFHFAVYVNEQWVKVGDTHPHIVIGANVENWISVENDNYDLPSYANIYYQHSYIGSPFIYIAVDDDFLGTDISSQTTGVIQYRCVKAGVHTAKLVLGTPSNYIVLDIDNFTVGEGITDTTDEFSIKESLHEIFTDEQLIIIGLFILGAITFAPFIYVVKKKLRNTTVNIPSILYGVCFGIGVIVDYVLGFFDEIVLFFICFIFIAVLAMGYIYNKRPTEG